MSTGTVVRRLIIVIANRRRRYFTKYRAAISTIETGRSSGSGGGDDFTSHKISAIY